MQEEEVSIKLEIVNFVDKFRTDVVIVYADNVRVVHDWHGNMIQQEKIPIVSDKYFIKYIGDGVCLPCRYSNQLEVPRDTKMEYPTHLVLRMILYEKNGVRISVDCECGVYWLKGEVENFEYCDTFFELYRNYMREYRVNVKYNKIEVSDLNLVTCRVLRHFCELDEIPIDVVKFKYNGYKGKLFVRPNNSLIYVDAMDSYEEIKQYPLGLNRFVNFIFQVERMPDCVIITDVVGVQHENRFYILSPLDALNLLGDLYIPHAKFMLSETITISGQKYQCFVQSSIEKNPIALGDIDGYIIVSGVCEYKYKSPSCDVTMRASVMTVGNEVLGEYNLEDGIYEITEEVGGKIQVLRRRFDRKVGATCVEYENFKMLIKRYYERVA
jgi:hypothetical protein